MYLPADGLFTRELVQRIHVETLHGGLTLTMAAIREEYWTPKLKANPESGHITVSYTHLTLPTKLEV